MPFDEKRWQTRLTSPARRSSLTSLRAQIRASLSAFPPETVLDVELVATELVTNAHDHGLPPVSFRLCTALAGWLRVEVSDNSPALPRVNHPDRASTHGRGLLLVQAVSRRWGTKTSLGGKTVWAEIFARTETEKP